MKKAFVHEWFEYPAGSEQCVESFMKIWPDFDIFALVDFFSPEARDKYLLGKQTTTSFIQRLPGAEKHFRNYLPLFPLAIEQLDVSGYDVVFSNSHSVAKGVLTKCNQLHICYCHTPMRYAWDLYHQYLHAAGLDKGLKSAITRYFLHRIRIWDYTTANRVDHFIANSNYTASRIKKIYNKPAEVIYPPVDVDKFPCESNKDEYYITVSRLVYYKKIDLVVEAFSQMPDKKLLVIGEGSELPKIKALAGKNVELLGYRSPAELKVLLQKAKAFVFAAEEDFGIVVPEALSCGTPVIALRKGGAKETVIDGVSGVHFNEQTVPSIMEAVKRFEGIQDKLTPEVVAQSAARFSRPRFEREVQAFVEAKINEFFD
jgi:glycosyltransferase involved in cell wall biosynthesis